MSQSRSTETFELVSPFEPRGDQPQAIERLVSGFADTVGESEIPVLRLVASYMDIGEALRERISGWFESNYGITLTDFVVENVSLPPEVEKMLDKRSSMGLLGDMGKYTQFQTAEAIGKMAEKPGGGGAGGAFMDAGMGLAMGQVMGGAIAGAQGGMAGGPPPPPLSISYCTANSSIAS